MTDSLTHNTITTDPAAARALLRDTLRTVSGAIDAPRRRRLYDALTGALRSGTICADVHGLHPLVLALQTVRTISRELEADASIVEAILLNILCSADVTTPAQISREWGDDVGRMVASLRKVATLYDRRAAVLSENFRNLLMTFASDIRVIIIMIVDRLELMKAINHHPDDRFVQTVAFEASSLYAPLAHRLGLYHIKSQLEDLSLKYTHRDIYTDIARGLNAKKEKREAYIANFIGPVKAKLEAAGLKFDIKGRTKSISSIYNKIRKQNNDLEHIYDLFAIRIILDTEPDQEKTACWMAYSLITDMYTPNPARMKDWISIPKSNGYESLHITVRGPEGKWVEVQIRTRRMDLIAEKGLAAHWKYKGIKSESDLDKWVSGVRDILESAEASPMELMKGLKMDIYRNEVFVFTPRGDLHRLPEGATVLDFAFSIHSNLGCQCIGAVVNGRNRRLNYKLQSGDTVEITTSASQVPKTDWLNIVVTSKARSKIRQTINERARRAGELGKELLERRFRNRKIEIDEGLLSKVVKQLRYKTMTDFYVALAEDRLDSATVIAEYELTQRRLEQPEVAIRSAEEFTLQPTADSADSADTASSGADEPLVIGEENIKGLKYKLSRCCSPVTGDAVFGFISSEGVIKVHREDCPNAKSMRQRYGYRVIPVRWSSSTAGLMAASLRIVGRDDLGIVTNITSIISKHAGAYLRTIAIDSHDGMFSGQLVVGVDTLQTLNSLIKKLKTVKGVKDVQRSN